MPEYNEMDLTKEEIAKLMTELIFKNNITKKEYALQVFMEALILPEDVTTYGEETFEKYLLDFMGNKNKIKFGR